jgi:hypothetical protein
MTKEKIKEYKRSDDLNPTGDCSDCSDCYSCKNAKNLKYAICNVELTKEEYEKKIKELNQQF